VLTKGMGDDPEVKIASWVGSELHLSGERYGISTLLAWSEYGHARWKR